MRNTEKYHVLVLVLILANLAFLCWTPVGFAASGSSDPTSTVDLGTSQSLGIKHWIQTKKLTPADGASYDFGSSVSLSGDGNTLIVGNTNESFGGSPGAAYVFTRSGGTWTQQAKLTAMDGANYDLFGKSVALNYDGNMALVGAPNAHDISGRPAGALYIFIRSGGVWNQQTKLLPDDPSSQYYSFGISIAVSGDGQRVLVGTAVMKVAYIFSRSGGAWIQQAKLSPDPGLDLTTFGNPVSLDFVGNTAIVGGYNFQMQSIVLVFIRSGDSWSQHAVLPGNMGGLSGDGQTILLGGGGSQVNVFTRSGNLWIQQSFVAGDFDIGSVALSNNGSIALLGAPMQNAAYVYQRLGDFWSQQAKLSVFKTIEFGRSVALSGDIQTALIGAWDGTMAGMEGTVYVFSQAVSLSYLPFISKPPPLCSLTVVNNTGGSLCFEVFGTGLGQQCFGSGTFFYGTFPAGSYNYSATAVCGSLNRYQYFPEGEQVITFSCS